MPREKALLFVKLNPPVNEENNFNCWYNEKHIPDRMNLPGFLSARRFTRIAGIPKDYAVSPEAEYLALYDLTDINVLRDVRYKALQEKEKKLPLDSFETRIFELDRFARGIYEQIYPEDEMNSIPQADFVFIVGHEVPRNRHQEFNAWYNTEHYHSGIDYVTPDQCHRGLKDKIVSHRKANLANQRNLRKEVNRSISLLTNYATTIYNDPTNLMTCSVIPP